MGKNCSSKIRALLKKRKSKKFNISVTKKDMEKIPIFHKNQIIFFFVGVNGLNCFEKFDYVLISSI